MVKIMPYSEQEVQPSARTKNGTIACPICSALYAPSSAHAYLLQAPRIASESAFMSMCHFCFRCRRPACPLCWDDVHGICGTCGEEMHLPFRKEGEPLPLNSTLLVSPISQPKQHSAASSPLVCVFPGRFQPEASQGEYVLAPERMETSEPVPDIQQQQVHEAPASSATASHIMQKGSGSIAQRIEHAVTLLLGAILFLIAVLIVLSSFSEQANTIIANVLHVDIRMEIRYLLQLIQQFH